MKTLSRFRIVPALLILTILAASTFAQPTWSVFWKKFRSAVAASDKKAVRALSSERISDQDYRQLFGTSAKKRCFAKARPVRDEHGAYSVFCGEQGYYFEKVNGQFKFKEPFPND